MKDAGIDPAAIGVVAIAHFRPDHIGGLADYGCTAFPNARYVIA